MSSFEAGYPYGDDWELAEEDAWADGPADGEIADALRAALRDEYADADDADLVDAATDMMSAMSPAEAFNFGAALSQIGKSAGQLASDPTFASIARTVAPIAGGALGSVIGGPAGTALGSKFGALAVSALPAPRPAPARPSAPPPSAPPPPAPAVLPAPPALPAAPVSAPAPAAPVSPVAAGSAAAAQGLVLSQHPEVMQALLATALGQQGRREVSGIPAAQLLGLLSQVLGQAAADADELMYNEQLTDAAESAGPDSGAGSLRSLYCDLLGADNLELAEAGWDGPDR